MKHDPSPRFVAYFRVSTDRQGRSGLGLEAQREAVERYAASIGADLLATFTEVESGAVRNRPELTAALDLCRRRKAILLIAKLDRLSRSLAFVAQLLEANVDIRAVDMPEANRMMLQMLAVFAEHERRMIGERTKAALAAAKARGVKLGANGVALARAHRNEASAFAESIRPQVEAAVTAGCTTTRQIADWLNSRGFPSREGGAWHPASVQRVQRRLGAGGGRDR
jgi:DNA invertase Pin-like site-specific DNA recombinase